MHRLERAEDKKKQGALAQTSSSSSSWHWHSSWWESDFEHSPQKMVWPLIAQGNLYFGGWISICGKSLNVQKNLEFFLSWKSVTADGSLLSPTGGVKGMYPALHIHEHLRYTNGYGKLRTSSRTTWTTWSTLRTIARTPQSTLTCTMRSSEHAAHRLLMHMCSHIALVAQGLALCVIPYHPCMRTCVLSLEWFLLTRLSSSSSSSSSSSTWCPSRRLMRWDLHGRSPVRLQLGEHGHSGLCHTPHTNRNFAYCRWRRWG